MPRDRHVCIVVNPPQRWRVFDTDGKREPALPQSGATLSISAGRHGRTTPTELGFAADYSWGYQLPLMMWLMAILSSLNSTPASTSAYLRAVPSVNATKIESRRTCRGERVWVKVDGVRAVKSLWLCLHGVYLQRRT